MKETINLYSKELFPFLNSEQYTRSFVNSYFRISWQQKERVEMIAGCRRIVDKIFCRNLHSFKIYLNAEFNNKSMIFSCIDKHMEIFILTKLCPTGKAVRATLSTMGTDVEGHQSSSTSRHTLPNFFVDLQTRFTHQVAHCEPLVLAADPVSI